jgi:CubicO group peptidase (beta-lactamase class C family)
MILQVNKTATMSDKFLLFCRKCSPALFFLLVLQVNSLQAQFDPVSKWLQNNIKDLGGRAVVLIYKDGKVLYNHAENDMSGLQKFAGKRVAEKQGKDSEALVKDFDSHTKILIASCSKWLSAALVMTFVDDGSLKLEDSVGKYLPVMTANGKGHIKIWHCLSHLTGIKTPPLREGIQQITSTRTMDAAIEKIALNPMEGEPGKIFHYSNAGLQIAAAVIEKISGKDFKTLFRERITIPCEMPDTDFGKANVPLAAGGASSTATDYLHFLSMMLNNGQYNGKRVLSEASVAAMQVNRISADCTLAYTPAEAAGWGYGFGEWVSPACELLTKQAWPCTEINTRSSFASSPGLFGSFPWIDNEKKYAGILLTFGFKSKGRNERYRTLKKLVDAAVE